MWGWTLAQSAAFPNKRIKNHVYKMIHRSEADKVTSEAIREVRSLGDDFHCTVKGTKAPKAKFHVRVKEIGVQRGK